MIDPALLLREADRVYADYVHAARSAREERGRFDEAIVQHRAFVAAQSALASIAEEIQNTIHSHIAAIVSRALTTVFGEDAYEFKFVFETKRGKTECRPAFFRQGVECDPLRSIGGGVLDVAAFALRLAAVLMSLPPVRRLLLLDEPFAKLSSEYVGRVSSLLLELSKELKIQIVMVTHNEKLKVGKIVEF